MKEKQNAVKEVMLFGGLRLELCRQLHVFYTLQHRGAISHLLSGGQDLLFRDSSD